MQLRIVACLLLLCCVACGKKRALLEIDAPLSAPESVLHDTAADVYLVSNVVGAPSEKDGRAFITRINPDGKIREARFIEGGKNGAELNAPKGLAIVEPYLLVADIDVLRVFERETGKAVRAIPIPGAKFLNDVVAFDAMSALVSDTETNRIHRVRPDGKVALFAEDPALGGANGLLRTKDSVIVVGFSNGAVNILDQTGKIRAKGKPPAGELDGVVAAWNGKILASSWKQKAVVELAGDKAPIIFGDLSSPADLGWDAKRQRLLVPLMGPGKLLVFEAPKP